MKFGRSLYLLIALFGGISILLGNVYAVVTTYTDTVVINPGNLGVGTNSPSAKIEVNAGSQTSGTDAAIFEKVRSSTNAVRYTFTDVGGVTSDSNGGALWRGFHLAAPAISVSGTAVYPRLATYAQYNSLTDPTTRLWVIDATNANGANQKHDIEYRIAGVGVLHMASNGNIGIGTNSPSEKLDVAGNIRLTGNIVSPNDICLGAC